MENLDEAGKDESSDVEEELLEKGRWKSEGKMDEDLEKMLKAEKGEVEGGKRTSTTG